MKLTTSHAHISPVQDLLALTVLVSFMVGLVWAGRQFKKGFLL